MCRRVICGGQDMRVENLVARIESLRGRNGQGSAILLFESVTTAEIGKLP